MDNAIARMRRGHAAASERARELARSEGPRPEQAVAEAIAALAAMLDMGAWPGPRDPVTEASVERVRQRWARIGHRAQQARER